MRDLFKTIDALDITPDEVWTAVSYINDLGASSEAGLLAPGLGLEHFLDLRMDAEDKQGGVRTGTPRTIEGPLLRGGRSALEREGEPVALAGDYNVIPTDIDVYKPDAGLMMRSSCQRYGARSLRFSRWAGPTRCANYIQASTSTPFGITSEITLCAMPACASIICF